MFSLSGPSPIIKSSVSSLFSLINASIGNFKFLFLSNLLTMINLYFLSSFFFKVFLTLVKSNGNTGGSIKIFF